jgi:DNA-binding NarL/FixJ family response regulator/signal transduction histidine kinase
MPTLYLTPAAIGYLTQLVLALAITAYLVYRLRTADRRNQDTRSLRLVAGIFVTVTVLVLLLFGDAALAPTPRLYAVYGENTVIGILLILLFQFAYAFPQRYPQRRWEARGALALSLAYTLWEAGFALYRGLWLLPLDQVLYRPRGADYAMAVLFLGVPLAYLRQMTATPRPSARRALRGFALILLIPLVLSLLTLARGMAAIHPAVFQSSLAVGILLTQFLFALNYLNALPALISFQVRLVGITLLVVLAVFGAVGWALTPPHAAVYRPALADQQTLRFTPNAQGGYDVTPVAFQFDPEPGAPLAMEVPFAGGSPPDAQAAVPFTFPFYGETVETLWVLQSGAVGMGASLHLPSMEYHYAATPAIFPLFVTLDTASGGVFAKDEGERLALTWQGLRGWHDRQATYTFQLVLYRDGVFTITTNGLPDAPYEPNTSPFSNVWVTGATPGLREQRPQRVNFAGGPQGVLQDHYLEFRTHLHHLLAPLAVLILVSSIGVTLGFPIVFYLSLIRPLNALLAGVRRVKDGDLETTMPVQHYDEIGFLAEAFNDMVAQLHDFITRLETRVATRTAALTQANEQLRQEMDERQAAQAQVLQHERALAAAEEREQLGRELHDGLGQVMGYVNVQAQAIRALLQSGQIDPAASVLRQLEQVAQDVHADVRAYILGIRTAAVPATGFLAALRLYLDALERAYGFRVTLDLPPALETSPGAGLFAPEVEAQLLRIVQEALTNVRKHAGVTAARVSLALQARQAEIVITDEGCGFDLTPSTPPSLAGKHVLSAGAGGDRGIGHFGLSVMVERAQSVGGSVEVASAPGQGTPVTVRMPLAMAAGAGVSGLRVLLADDHPLFLDGLRNMLTAHGMNVVGLARDGVEAAEQAIAVRPDLVLLDIQMPRCNGLEAARRIKASLPAATIVMLTVAASEESLFEALKLGASGYILKSVSSEQFFDTLASLLRGEPVFSPEVAARILADLAPVAPGPRGVVGAGRKGSEPKVLPGLIERQTEVLRLVAQGLTYKEVGARLCIAEVTVKYHMGEILNHLHVQSRKEAVAYAVRRGLARQ